MIGLSDKRSKADEAAWRRDPEGQCRHNARLNRTWYPYTTGFCGLVNLIVGVCYVTGFWVSGGWRWLGLFNLAVAALSVRWVRGHLRSAREWDRRGDWFQGHKAHMEILIHQIVNLN